MDPGRGPGERPNKRRADERALIVKAKSGDERAFEKLLTEYRFAIRSWTRGYFLPGADRDDLLQEAAYGFFKAVRDYDLDGKWAFSGFAQLCVTRQAITTVKAHSRGKHQALTHSQRFERPAYVDGNAKGSEQTLGDLIAAHDLKPDESYAASTLKSDIIEAISSAPLSELEAQLLLGYYQGKSYDEIANDLNRAVKSCDNGLQRAKSKIGIVLARLL